MVVLAVIRVDILFELISAEQFFLWLYIQENVSNLEENSGNARTIWGDGRQISRQKRNRFSTVLEVTCGPSN